MISTTQRDLEIIQTLNMLKIMTSSQIQRLFFYGNQSHQSRRCRQLVNHKKIKVYRKSVYEENVYYIKKKPKQQEKSMLLLSEFYVRLKTSGINIVNFQREYTIGKVRADGFMTIEREGFEYDFLIEIDLTHCDGFKYLKIKEPLPPIISISPYKRKYPQQLEVYHISKTFSDFKHFLSVIE